MALTGFGRKCAITIDHTKVGATLTDFPILLTKDTLPSEMFDADGSNPALNGGGDIRFSSDADGNTQLACEVVAFVTDNDPANGSAEIWVKIPSLSSSTDTVIYVWYNKSGESQPAVDDTYGRNAVWSDVDAYFHLEESSGSRVDSAGNMALTDSGSPSNTTGKIGSSIILNGTNQFIYKSSLAKSNPHTLDFWVYENSRKYSADPASSRVIYYSHVNYAELASNNGSLYYAGTGGAWRGTGYTLPFQTWTKITVVTTTSGITIYANGTSVYSYASDKHADFNNQFNIGVWGVSGNYKGYFNGSIDGFKMYGGTPASGQLVTEYNNQNSPATFAVEGTPESAGGGTPASTWTPKIIIF